VIPFEEALDRVLAEAKPLGTEERALETSLGRALAESVVAPFDVPRFDSSAVDGFGVLVDDVRSASPDRPIRLTLTGTVPAGADAADTQVGPGMAVKVFTGAPIPPGADAVVMQEDVEQSNGALTVKGGVPPGQNIRRKAEEFSLGDVLFERGTLVTPAVLASLGSLGLSRVEVGSAPRVGIVSTGDELVSAGLDLGPGQIYESNSLGLAACLRALGIEPSIVLRVRDDRAATAEAFARVFETCDVAISTGGVSVGEFDAVKGALSDLGVHEVFWGIALKPGKPVYFGVHEAPSRRCLVFGLPGNPVSALVTFLMLVSPAIRTMSGHSTVLPPAYPASLAERLEKRTLRLELVRAKLETKEGKLIAYPLKGQASHMLGTLGRSEALIRFPRELETLEAGETVTVHPILWGWA